MTRYFPAHVDKLYSGKQNTLGRIESMLSIFSNYNRLKVEISNKDIWMTDK